MTTISMGMPSYCTNGALLDMTLNCVRSFLDTVSVELDGVWVYENAPPNDYQTTLKEQCQALNGVQYVYWKKPFHMNNIYNTVISKAPTSDVIVCCNNDLIFHEGWLDAAIKYLRLTPNDDSPYVMVEPLSEKRDDDFAETHRKLPERDRTPHTLNSQAGYCLILAGWYARQHPFNPEIAFGGQDHIQRAEIEANGYLTALASACYVEHLDRRTKLAAHDRVAALRQDAAKYWKKYGNDIGSW